MASFVCVLLLLSAAALVVIAQDFGSPFGPGPAGPGPFSQHVYMTAPGEGDGENENVAGGQYVQSMGSANGEAFSNPADEVNQQQVPNEQEMEGWMENGQAPTESESPAGPWDQGFFPPGLRHHNRRFPGYGNGRFHQFPAYTVLHIVPAGPAVNASNSSVAVTTASPVGVTTVLTTFTQATEASNVSDSEQRRRRRAAIMETVIPPQQLNNVNDTTSRVLVPSTGALADVPTGSLSNFTVERPGNATFAEISHAQVPADKLKQRRRRFSGYGMGGGYGFPSYGQSAGTAIGTANALQGFSSSSGNTLSQGGMSRSLALGEASGLQPSSTSIANSQSQGYMRRRRDAPSVYENPWSSGDDSNQQPDSATAPDYAASANDEDFSQPQQTDDSLPVKRRKRAAFVQVFQTGPGTDVLSSASDTAFNVTVPAGSGVVAVASSGSSSN